MKNDERFHVEVGDILRLAASKRGPGALYAIVTDVKGDFLHYIWAEWRDERFVPTDAGALVLSTRDQLKAEFELERLGPVSLQKQAAAEKRRAAKANAQAPVQTP